ncbi:hypothetical protein BME96_01175 [Virgibacillus halodenitrificans]|uniref:Uncharacterized protein n=1 Tax=Virgibacillus halodenitrificans TaxID=1482 RepID=A0AAC9NJI9_VIRHA|nr:hypothetical protein BME96_01175 [Virgibacillus halodenitrificans]
MAHIIFVFSCLRLRSSCGPLLLPAFSVMLGTSGLLAAYSVEGLLVALPTELMAHIIFVFSCLRLRSSCGPLLLPAFSMMPGTSGLLAAYSVEGLLVALPTECLYLVLCITLFSTKIIL